MKGFLRKTAGLIFIFIFVLGLLAVSYIGSGERSMVHIVSILSVFSLWILSLIVGIILLIEK